MPITTPDRPPATTLSAAPVNVAGRDEVADAVAARVAFIAVVGTMTAEEARLETEAATLEATAAAEEARLEAEAATEEATALADDTRDAADARTELATALADDTRDAATEETAPAAEERADATREGMLWWC
jgi:hypothetical protein